MTSDVQPPSTQRIVSVDALRGYTMFGTVAGASLLAGLAQLQPSPVVTFLRHQFTHSDWHGLTYYDLGFPCYLMLMGTAIALSLEKYLRSEGSKLSLYPIVLRRTGLLFLIGIVYGGGFADPWPEVRLAGIIQRLAICYLAGVVIYLHMNTRWRVMLLLTILFGYWAMMALITVPEYGAGDYSVEGNLTAYVDSQFLPGRKIYGSWDPEGLLSTLPAIATLIIGILLGEWLRGSQRKPQDVVFALLVVSFAGINLGLLWDQWFPMNKKLWTSSYVVATAGWACLHLAFFHQIAEVWGFRKLVYPFVVFGRNAIAVFVGVKLIDFDSIARRLVGGSIGQLFGDAAELLVTMTSMALVWLILYWLNRNKIDIKL